MGNNPLAAVDLLGLVSAGDPCDCSKKPCEIKSFLLMDNGTKGTSVKAVISLLTSGDCENVHYSWYDCITHANGPIDTSFDKTIPRTDLDLHVAANLSFLTCDPSTKKWTRKSGMKSLDYRSWYFLGGWWFNGDGNSVWPPS